MQKIGEFMQQHQDKLIAPVFIGDQSPNNPNKRLYWTQFLHQRTPVMLGAEKYAKQYDLPVLFLKQKRVKRGYYTIELVLLEENPRQTAEFEITEKHTRVLEEMIQAEPQYWLWSHKRWKHSQYEPNS